MELDTFQGRSSTAMAAAEYPHPFAAPASVQRFNFPTQASRGLEWATRPGGSVKDVPGHFVKHVMGLDTKGAKSWGTRPSNAPPVKAATRAPQPVT